MAVTRRARFASAGRLVLAGLVLAALALGPAPASAQADTAPHAFNFLNKSGPPSTVVTSDEITVAGLGTSVSVTAQLRFCRFLTPDRNTGTTTGAACTLVKNGVDVSGSSTTVANGDKVKIKVTSNSTDGGHAQVRVDIGTGLFSSAWFTVTTVRTVDTTPDSFSFLDKSGPPSTVVTSNEITVAGVDGSVTARFSSCRFRAPGTRAETTTGAACTLVKNGTDVSGSSTTVANGDKVKIKVTSNSADGGQAQVKVYIGTLFDWFTVTTAVDTTPDPFSFTDQSYVAPSTVVTSNEITVAGLGTSVTARFNFCRFEAPVTRAQTTTGAACTLVKNGTDVSGSSTTVANGDKIAVKVTSHGSHVGRALVRVYIGTGTTRSSWFRVTTWDPMDTTPDFFSFARQFDVAPSTVVTSNEITVAGVDGSVTARFNFCRFEAPVTGARTTTGAACTLVKNGTDVSGSSTTVANGDRVKVKVTSNSAGSGGALVKVDIGTGGYSYSWFTVTTAPTVPAPVDTTPDPFSFTRQSDAAPGTVVTSNEITVAGLGTSVSARIGTCRFGVARTATNAACTLVKNGADVSGSSTTVANGDRIAVKVTSDSVGSGSVEAIVGIGPGAYSTSMFVVTTRPTVTLALSPASISESGGVSRVTATLSGASSEAVTVTVSVAAVAPATSGDFALSSATTLTIAAGSTRSWGRVTIAAVDNSDDEPNKQVTVSGTASGGNGVAAPSSRTLTLIDDEGLPTVTLALSPSSILENGGVATVTATLDRAASAATTVTVSAAAVAPAAAGDFALSSATTLTIASGQTASTGAVTVTAVDNATDAPDKSVTVSGTASGGGGVANPSSVTLTITDDEDLPEVTLALSPATIDEHDGTNPGSSTVTATLDRASSEAVTLTVSASPGSGTDFTLSSANTLTIAAGDTTSTGTVTITAVNDTTDAPDKSVTVSATAAGGNGVSAPSSVTLTITDDEALPEVTLALSPSSIDESGASNVSTVTATLNRPSSAAVTLTVSASPGSGTDFTLSSANTLTIAAGSTTSAGTVTITAVNNATDAPDKSVTVSATAAGGNGVAAPPDVTLTIADDEDLPEVALALSSTSVSESGGVSTVTATLSGASSEAVTVTVSATGVTASAGDFARSSARTLTIASGSTTSSGTVTVSAVGDTTDEADETVSVSGTVSGGNGVSAPPSVTLTIADDDAAPTVSIDSPSVTEGTGATGGTLRFTVVLSAASGKQVTVAYADAGTGTATSGTDYTAIAAGTLTFAAGTTARTIDVTVTGDALDEVDETVAVTLSTPVNATLAAAATGTGTVTDDEALPTVALVLSPATIDESGTGNATTVTATLSGASSEAVTVTVSAAPGTNAVSGDYTLSTATTLTIAAGSTASSGTVTVTAVDNSGDEPNIQVTVSATAAGGNGVTDPDGVTLTIRDDEGPPLATLALSPASISENGGVSTVTATLNRASSAATTVTVSASGSGFTLSSARTLTIAAGGTTSAGTVTVTAVDDATDAPDRSVTVSGSASNTQGVTDPSNVTLTITDDDAAPGVTLSVASSSIPENGGSTTVSAKLSHPSSAATTVTVSALADAYSVAPGSGATIVISAGSTTSTDTATITAVDNDVDAADSDVMVTGTAQNSQGAGTVTGASLTITDDDVAALVLSPAPSASLRLRTTESGGTATFTVALASEPTGDVVLGVTSSNTAEGMVSPSSLTFTATTWSTAQTVTLTGVDDSPTLSDPNPSAGDQDYTVTLTVNTMSTADANYDALSDVTVYAVNADNEYGLNVGSVTGQATEAGGTAMFTVALITQPSQAVTVTVSSLDASEGAASPSSLTFATTAWNTAVTVTVTGADDAIDDGTVTWAVRLDPSSGDDDYDGLANVDVSVTTTDDDGAPGVTLALSPASISESGAGNVSTVTATLSHPSSAATTVTVTPVTGFYTVGSDATIVIAAGETANATDTVTIAAVDNDTDAPDRAGTVTATITNDRATADGTTMAVSGGALTIGDDDAAPNATLSLNPSSVSENGGAATVTATLSHPSSAATTVTVTAASGSLYTVGSDATIVIAAGETANATDTAAIAAADNTKDEPDRTATVTATLTNSQGAGTVSGATLTLTDDDAAPGVTLAVADTSIPEGGSTTVSATLSHPSSAATTVTVTAVTGVYTVGSDATIAIAAGETANATDTAAIAAVDNDVDAADVDVTVTGTAANSQAAANSETMTVTGASLTIANDDDAGLVVSPTPSSSSRLRTTEGGGTATFTVKLATRPTGDVVLGVASSDTAEGTVSPSSLTFTATTWNTAQTVTLTGVDDSPTSSDPNPSTGNRNYEVTLTVNTTSTVDANYDALSAVTVYAVNADNEYGLDVSSVTGPATEAGEAATFTVALRTQPTAPVTVAVTSGDASEGTVSPSSLIFETSDWNTAQTVTATGVDDDWDDGDVAWNVRLRASSGDSNYHGLAEDVSVTTKDGDDAPDVTLAVSPSSISENGGVATVTATLSRRSVAATTVTVTASPVAPAMAGDYTLSAATVTIAAGSISSSTVTIAANDNDVAAADKTVTVSGTAANDRAAADLEAVAVTSATLTIRDNDEKGFAFDPAEFIEVTEGNPDGTGYTVALTSEPVGTVTVTVSGRGRVTASPTTLKFAAIADSANSVNRWDAAQAVTVTATDDGNDYAEPSSVSHTASGGDYGGVSGSPPVSRSLPVSVKDETAVRTDGASTKTERTYFIEGRKVEVTVGAGVPEGIVVDFKGVKAVAAATTVTMSISQDVPTATVERAKGDGFNLGPKESRRMVNIDVSPAPSSGLRICLPVTAAVVAGARDAGRLRLLRDDGSVWAPVAGAEEYDAAMSRICASGVKSFGPFATGYVDTTPAFPAFPKAFLWEVDKAVDPVTLPLVKEGTGDPPINYALTPAPAESLPPGIVYDKERRSDKERRRLSGTPEKEFRQDYTWTATDVDGNTAELTFSIEVEPALAKARARLKAINESVLPELSRALWGSALGAVTGRLESPDAAAPTAAGGLEAAATFARANESALEEGDVSWKELLGGESFAFGLAADGEDGPGAGGVVAWGSGDWRRLSRDEDALDWSGDAFSAHLGVDAALRPDLRGGLAASWFSSDVDYTDRSQGEAIAGSHESRMTALTPYLGWAAGGGTRLWGAAGYGWGEIEIVDGDLRERFGAQKADSRFLAGAAGGSVPVWSRGSATLKAKGSAEATRWRVKDNGAAIAAVSVDTQRLRLAAEGSRAYALPDGTSLTPTLEAGVRWDGGDGATGMGLEAGGGLSWTDPARGLTMEAEGRALVAHNKDVEEWGASGSMRLDPDADGFGLSFRLLPSWGASGSGVARLWDEGVAAARPADGGGGNEARLETELGYGLPAFGGAGVTTPYAGFGLAQGGERDMRAGVRLGLGTGFDLGIEAKRKEGRADTEHGVGLELRIRW